MSRPVAATPAAISRAAELLRAGELVAFPTETVYGLGACALNTAAVGRIFDAKGRPRTSPLIAHVSSVDQARTLVDAWPPEAQALADAFWPGPLTLVLPKAKHVPDALTGGLEWLGVRLPAHAVALSLIRETGEPLAAPSANPFMQLSPTTAEHVAMGLGSAAAMILDGGPCGYGIESTVIRIREGRPELLRLGAIPKVLIERVLGRTVTAAQTPPSGPHASPGQHARHYAPKTPLLLWRPGQALPPGDGALLARDTITLPGSVTIYPMPTTAEDYARLLYARLHALDASGYAWIAVQAPEASPEWAAVHDRLQRATYPA